jgi:hypothetical protein
MENQEQTTGQQEKQERPKNAADSDLKVNEHNGSDTEPKTGVNDEADKGDETAGSVSVTE